ncbi:MAG: hypothetical protein IT188_09205, partial [Acidobacteria bacterium]|nr:hypothetical protein [Acidobacteriota bacterium]
MKTWTAGKKTRITRALAGRSNVFLVSGGGKRLLVDTSPRSLRRRRERRLRRLGADRLEAVVPAPAHYVQAGNSEWLRERFGAGAVA